MFELYKLPIKPVSTNETLAFSKSAGRFVKTKIARRYKDDLLMILPKKTIPDGELMLIARFGLSNNASDTDNCIKPFQDALQTRYGFNDKLVKAYVVEGVDVKVGHEFIEFALITKKELSETLMLASCSSLL